MNNTLQAESTAPDVDNDAQVRMAVETLEEDIAFGYMHPRERLVEDELRARFGLKRHVVDWSSARRISAPWSSRTASRK
jgi:DNA-binding GntR family transcriptional regulator